MTTAPPSRFDKKCGNSGIPDSAKCTKQTSNTDPTQVQAKPRKRSSTTRPTQQTFAEKALMLGGTIGMGIGGASWVAGLGTQIGLAGAGAGKGKDRYLRKQRELANSYSAGIVRSVGGAIGSVGTALVGASMHMQGTRTRNSNLAQSGQRLMVSGALGATISGLSAKDFNDKRLKTVEESRQYTARIRRARAGTRAARKQAEAYKRWAEQARSRYANRGGTGRANTAVPDPYKDLGVSETASTSEIRAAWKKKMREAHPDQGGNAELAKRYNAAMAEIRRRRGDRADVYAYGFAVDFKNLEVG